MWNKVLVLGLLTLVGCANLAPADYREENLSVLSPEDEQEVIQVPPVEVDQPSVDIGRFESSPPVDIELTPGCECHLEVTQSRGLICFGTVCAESCPQQTRDCATLMGGCTVR